MSATTHSTPPSKPSRGKSRSQFQGKTQSSKPARKKHTARRTTVSLSAASSDIVERFKAATGLSTSRAIEELILRSEPRKPRIKMVNGRAVIDLPVPKGSITTEQILLLEDEPW